MKNILLILASTSILLSTPLSVAATSYRPEIQSALQFLERSQYVNDTTETGPYEPGQWDTEVKSILIPSLLGAGVWGKKYPETTNFTTAMIVETLGSMYQQEPSLRSIPKMSAKAIAGNTAFRQGALFNFYPPGIHKEVQVRGPRTMFLAPYIKGLANVPADADSTSMGYLALNSFEMQKNGARNFAYLSDVPEETFETFSKYRDVSRPAHYYNRMLGYKNTGAFMTWLMDDRQKMPGVLAAPQKGPRIPFGRNDIDCVVNTNVMKLMTIAGRTSQPGYKETCEYLKGTIDRGAYGFCGIYYPNSFSEVYGLAQLLEMKTSCLESHEQKLLDFILATQDQDGGWTNPKPARADRIQSSVLALNALAILGNPKNPEHRERVHRAAKFLLANSLRNDNGDLFWKGEVFFSAVSQARFAVVWRSNAYTTVLAARALLLAEKY
ncbi:MAG: hypothetical protein H7326_12050 [Bdellovibrionaceae bacterium]|nr:hypothetical protein [Pseudobdellovibrionaceae bacterium]